MNRKVFRKLAKENGVSVVEIKHDIQHAIKAAYINPNAAALAIPKKGDVPTADEFIAYCVREITPRPSNVRILH